ncbi:12807_t:CDS:2, partial [Racocetra fulgida]
DKENSGKRRSEIANLDISYKNLEGHLDLTDFVNLKKLVCSKNKLTSLNLVNCQQLERIVCSDNQLTIITLPSNPTNLKKIDLSNNNFPEQDLSFLTPYINLEELDLKNNNFIGSLDYLSVMKELRNLDISNTDINEVNIDKLPKKFTNIEYLASGGFSKIYKAKWEKCEDKLNKEKIIVLKVLTDSQEITLDFLTEIANTKLVEKNGFFDNNNIVNCHGISQDPQTKNYIMVMQYVENGNLRQCLQQKRGKLCFTDKLDNLSGIVNGLSSMHNHGLVHRDFHIGIQYSDCCITDLGLMAYELLANSYPYPPMDETELVLKVCDKEKPLRPNIDELKIIPQILKNLIKKCWDSDPLKRPSAEWLKNFFIRDLYDRGNVGGKSSVNQYHEIKFDYNNFSRITPYKIHPTAQLTSKMVDTREIIELIAKCELENQASEDSDLVIEWASDNQQQSFLQTQNQTFSKNKRKNQSIFSNEQNEGKIKQTRTNKELTDVVNQLSLPYEQIAQFKILELTQFMFAKETSGTKDIEASISFPTLLSELTGFNGKLVLLVYERVTQNFYHWDTLNGSPNHGYIKPLVRDLLQQLNQTNNPNLDKHLVLRDEIKQPNT